MPDLFCTRSGADLAEIISPPADQRRKLQLSGIGSRRHPGPRDDPKHRSAEIIQLIPNHLACEPHDIDAASLVASSSGPVGGYFIPSKGNGRASKRLWQGESYLRGNQIEAPAGVACPVAEKTRQRFDTKASDQMIG